MPAKKIVQKTLAILVALAVWQVVSMAVGMEFMLPSPVSVAVRLGEMLLEADFRTTVLFSLTRIVLGFLAAFVLGILLAVIAGRSQLIEAFLWPYVITIRSVPVASFIILSLLWLSGSQLPVFISFLMVFPLIYSNVLQGIKSADPKLLEMAAAYRVPWIRRLTHIYAPNVKPFLLSACSVSLGMSWKSGVAAEVIGIVNGSIGEKLYESKIYYMTAELFAWTVVIVLVSVLFEKVFLLLLKRAYTGLERL